MTNNNMMMSSGKGLGIGTLSLIHRDPPPASPCQMAIKLFTSMCVHESHRQQ